jgi:hypothetical protein
MSKIFNKHLQDNIEYIKSIKDSLWCLRQVCAALGYSENGRNTAAVNVFCRDNNIDISHFTQNGSPRLTPIVKQCLCCGKDFDATRGKRKTQTTCSHKCANTYYKPNKKEETTRHTYALAARNAGMTSCCICGEADLVDIHHIDHDRNNNSLDNLAPLCPTHHMYLHRGKADLIFDKFVEYLDTRVLP